MGHSVASGAIYAPHSGQRSASQYGQTSVPAGNRFPQAEHWIVSVIT